MDIGKLHCTATLLRDHRRFPLGKLFVGIQHLKDPLGGCHRGLQHIDDAHRFVDGVTELTKVTDKGLKIAHQQFAAQDHHRSHNSHQHIADIADKTDDGRQHTGDELCLAAVVPQLPVDLGKTGLLPLFCRCMP